VAEVRRQLREAGRPVPTPARTVLLDDSEANVAAARAEGIRAFKVCPDANLCPQLWLQVVSAA